MKMKIIRMEHNKHLPEYKTEGSSGMDLYAAIENEFDKKYVDIFKNDKLTETQMDRMFEFIEI